MKKGQMDSAIRRALNIFDDWNDITGFVVKDTGYYYEIQSCIEDAVHCGAQKALGVHEKLESEQDMEKPSQKEYRKIVAMGNRAQKMADDFMTHQAIAKRDEEWEKACRLYLQNAWNDQSEIQALSPKGKTIIWGGIIGKEITKEWQKILSYL